MSVKYILLWK